MTSTNRQQADSRFGAHAIGLAGLVFVAIGLTGCPSAGLPDSTDFAETETVAVGDGVTVEASLGGGHSASPNPHGRSSRPRTIHSCFV